MSAWIGIDPGDDHLHGAEQLAAAVLNGLLPEASLACTHMLYEPSGHYAASVELLRELTAAEADKLVKASGPLGAAIAVLIDTSET